MRPQYSLISIRKYCNALRGYFFLVSTSKDITALVIYISIEMKSRSRDQNGVKLWSFQPGVPQHGQVSPVDPSINDDVFRFALSAKRLQFNTAHIDLFSKQCRNYTRKGRDHFALSASIRRETRSGGGSCCQSEQHSTQFCFFGFGSLFECFIF